VQNDGFTLAGHACTSLRFGVSNGANFFGQGFMFTVMFWRLDQDPTRLNNLIQSLFIVFLSIMSNSNALT
jgi:hypothetical protein